MILDLDGDLSNKLPDLPGGDPMLEQALQLYTSSSDDTITAIEEDRHRLAGRIKQEIIEPLNLLLAQAHTYDQTLGANPTIRMAISVLASLARQILQQARDLEADLHPAVLKAIGLEPALQALANQVTRASGIQIDLTLERLPERLPGWLELYLFRAAQDGLTAALEQHATQVIFCLQRQSDALKLELQHNGSDGGVSEQWSITRQLIQRVGGTIETGRLATGLWQWTVHVPLPSLVQLTAREQEVIQAVAEGLSNKEIARQLSISPRTVNYHLDNLFAKLGVNSRTEAAIYALRQGWVPRSTPRSDDEKVTLHSV